MNCRDFDQIWNRLLDAESGPRRDDGPAAVAARRDREDELREHAETCPACLARHRQFQTLRDALRVWTDRPRPETLPDPATVDRVARAASRPVATAAPRRRSRPLAWTVGSAVAALAAAMLRPSPPDRLPPEPAAASRPDSLDAAVADARAASIRLALAASEPAARFGLAMLDASIAGDDDPDAAIPTTADTVEIADDLVPRLEGYAAAGVRPLSDAARNAFDFLRPPAIDHHAAATPTGT